MKELTKEQCLKGSIELMSKIIESELDCNDCDPEDILFQVNLKKDMEKLLNIRT